MKNKRSLLLAFILLGNVLYAQKSAKKQPMNNHVTSPPTPPAPLTNTPSSSFKYESVVGDPLNTRIYTLKNGFKAYLSVNKSEPRIQSYIIVKAGNKNNKLESSGATALLSMYMMFGGTDKYGTTNYELEKPLLNKIAGLYEENKATTDLNKRKLIAKKIDSISGAAAKVAIASEYIKMISGIGVKRPNAFTGFDKTWYQSDIPSNQLANFLTIESERFRNPVVRFFHTNLENIYESKNKLLDNEESKVEGALFKQLFKKHPYGSTGDFGTNSQLLNPTVSEVYDFFNTYYTPNNMAICLTGDFDPDETIKLIDLQFGSLPKKESLIPDFSKIEEEPIKEVVTGTIYSKNSESVNIAFRFDAYGSSDADMIMLIDKMLYNGTAGLIDLDLNQSQTVVKASSSTVFLNDYSILVLTAEARKNQKLEEAKELLLSEIEKLQAGDFPDWLLKASINEIKLKQKEEFESNEGRANFILGAYTSNTSYAHHVNLFERLSKITKQQIIDFCRIKFSTNYSVVYKKLGTDSNNEKVVKPIVTPITTNDKEQSQFLKNLNAKTTKEIEPKFVNFNEEIKKGFVNSNVPIWYVKNNVDDLFTLNYVFDFGSRSSKIDSLALSYLKLIGTSTLTAAQINEAFFKIGCYFQTKVEDDLTTITLKGLSENFVKAVKLFEMLLTDCEANKVAYGHLLETGLKLRQDAILNNRIILNNAMLSYGYFGKNSPYANVLNDDDLFFIYPYNLIDFIKSLKTFKHSIWYYGNLSNDSLVSQLNRLHQTQKTLFDVPRAKLIEQVNTYEDKVYAYDLDMKQAELIFMSKENQFNKDELPVIRLFQEYYGEGFQSVMFQTLRISKALAYSVYSRYSIPAFKEHSFFAYSYIGTQIDKLPDAFVSMHQLFDSLPYNQSNFETAKKSMLQKLRSERIPPSNYCHKYYKNLKLGIDCDERKLIYEIVPTLTFNDIYNFHKRHFKNRNHTTLLLGKKDKIKPGLLEKYGTVTWLTSKDIFGY